jgi:micrococcal nuclease
MRPRRHRAARRRRGGVRWAAALIAVMLAAAGGAFLSQSRPDDARPPTVQDVEQGTWWLDRVIDGDTLIVRDTRRLWGLPARRLTVRLLNVNTPERRQFGHAEATATLRRLTSGRRLTLRVERPSAQRARDDRYDRLLAYVFDGPVNVNVEVVRSGWSRYWTRYGPGRFPEAFRQAEDEARSGRRGLWGSDANP